MRRIGLECISTNLPTPKQNKLKQQTGAAFLSLRISDIVRGEIGTAEIALRDAFRAAMGSRPALVFIDEFQVSKFSS